MFFGMSKGMNTSPEKSAVLPGSLDLMVLRALLIGRLLGLGGRRQR
jgi:hypothetical protein